MVVNQLATTGIPPALSYLTFPFLTGKTHTMAGSKDGPMRGIIPRAVEQTISQVINMRANGWEISVTASMVT